jgi:hypothetical protein
MCMCICVLCCVDDLLNAGCEDEEYANKSFDDAAINKHDIICQARKLRGHTVTLLGSSNHAATNHGKKISYGKCRQT